MVVISHLGSSWPSRGLDGDVAGANSNMQHDVSNGVKYSVVIFADEGSLA
jgi:hypothetical protein